MRFGKLVFVVGLLLISSLMFAQKITWGGNLELAMPMGDFADMANMGFGATVQAEYPINEQFMGTGSIGYLMWGGKDAWEDMDYSWSCIPIKAGAKYQINETDFYGILELGIYMFSYEFELFGVTVDDSESEFGFAPGFGYRKEINEKMDLDISVQYEMVDDLDFLGIDIGLRF